MCSREKQQAWTVPQSGNKFDLHNAPCIDSRQPVSSRYSGETQGISSCIIVAGTEALLSRAEVASSVDCNLEAMSRFLIATKTMGLQIAQNPMHYSQHSRCPVPNHLGSSNATMRRKFQLAQSSSFTGISAPFLSVQEYL
jgi:hypothetical protein